MPGVEANIAHSVSIHHASLKQILVLLIKNPMRVARGLGLRNKSEKENTTACCLFHIRISRSIYTQHPVSDSIQEETGKEFAFPSELWPKVATTLSEHLMHPAFVNLSTLPFWICLCISKLTYQGAFNIHSATNRAFPLMNLVTAVLICCPLFLVQLEGGNGHCSFSSHIIFVWWTLSSASFPG